MAHIVACRRNQLVLPAVLALLGAPAVHAQTAAGLDSVRVALSGQLDVDTRVVRGPLPGRSGMLLRRAILAVDVTAPGGWALRLQPDFSQGRAGLLDAYVTWSHDALSVRLGRQEPPFGVEKPLSSTTLLFPEYGIISALMIGRLFGVRAGTETPRGTLTIGAYVPAGLQEALIDVERDPEGPPQLGPHGVARVTWRPAPAPADGSAPPRLEFQVAGAYGSYRASDPALSGLPRYLTPAQRPASHSAAARAASPQSPSRMAHGAEAPPAHRSSRARCT